MVILVTGAAGFIGSNFVHHWIQNHPNDTVIALDKLSPYSCKANIQTVEDEGKIRFYQADITDFETLKTIYQKEGVELVVNFAAESHNDRAILDPNAFARSNAYGAQVLLEVSRQVGVRRHVHVSTIEVYGEQDEQTPFFTEASPLNAKTPYSAAKAAGDLLVRSYMHTYSGMDICLTHCANNYGPYQFPEKLIPLAIANVIQGKKIRLYGDGLQKRDWLHVKDHCRAIELILLHSEKFSIPPEAATHSELLPIFDISAREEYTNRFIAESILSVLGKNPEEWIEYVGDRPNHDRRYLINPQKIETVLGFAPSISFADGFRETVEWYVQNRAWWEAILVRQSTSIDWQTASIPGR